MDAAAQIEQSIARHGGLDRWQRLERITLEFQSLTGMLMRMRGVGKSFPVPGRVEIDPRGQRATFVDYPTPGRRGRYELGRVALDEDALAEHRAAMPRGHWQPIDALYFFGYALIHYHSMPFSLGEATVRGWNERRRALTVEFPASRHTHNPVQTIYFDESGLIVRHDYVADVIGSWARGAHFWNEYVEVDGWPIATHRQVRPHLGRLIMPVVALDARLASPSVAFA